MRDLTDLFKLFTDEHRVRILLLLDRKELSVCQLMGIIGISQPLISRNLSLLYKGGFLEERRDGKLRFYSIRKDLSADKTSVLDLLKSFIVNDLNAATARKLLQEGAVVIDVRNVREYAKAHLNTAINVPLNNIESYIITAVPEKSSPILLHCRSGSRSMMGKRILRKMGYENTYNLGGFNRAKRFVNNA